MNVRLDVVFGLGRFLVLFWLGRRLFGYSSRRALVLLRLLL